MMGLYTSFKALALVYPPTPPSWVLFPVLVVQTSQSLDNLCPTVTSPFLTIVVEGAAGPPALVFHELRAHALPGQDGDDSWSETPRCEVRPREYLTQHLSDVSWGY